MPSESGCPLRVGLQWLFTLHTALCGEMLSDWKGKPPSVLLRTMSRIQGKNKESRAEVMVTCGHTWTSEPSEVLFKCNYDMRHKSIKQG